MRLGLSGGGSGQESRCRRGSGGGNDGGKTTYGLPDLIVKINYKESDNVCNAGDWFKYFIDS